MEVEVAMMPIPASMDFNFDSACSSPYMTAPSSPQRFGNFFFSAPTSPSRVSSSSSSINSSNRVFNVDQINREEEDHEDFEFNFSGQLERTSLSADELFDGGKIRPLKIPTSSDSIPILSSSTSKTENTQKRREFKQEEQGQKRGRELSISSSISRKGSRSLSPMRVSDIIYEQEENQTEKIISSTRSNITANQKSYASTILSAISFSSKNYKKWKLKDLLLFRSASEGRASSSNINNDSLRTNKYAVLSKNIKETEDVKNCSFRSTDSSSGSVSLRRKGGGGGGPPVSAHELHYTANRAVAEEMRRKTYLPYKQGLLGCLGFNPGGVHDISRGVGSLTRV
ncbi:hypothetical protein Dsin_027026 [Dipteronia sinensis]|uniref:Calmodulin-binding protein n=1 Tax=Dipteronia sinensis TaxID=43782 RepID=A0AAD9ZYZ3_9ROSI|nr:hypothetical protein Dsin_027026 [Dipteronia sinensis]